MSQSPTKVNSLFTRRRLLGVAAASFAGLVIDGSVSSSALRVERHTHYLPHWKANGFRVAQVSDVHVNNTGLRDSAIEAIQVALKFKPDLFVFTGDFVNAITDERSGYLRETFSTLADAACPCLAILGNHDYTCDDTLRLVREVGKLPIRLLRNEVVEVEGVSVVGLDDALWGRPDYGLTAHPTLSSSVLVLLHEPDFVTEVRGEPGLVLSGHSHGGEVCLPGGIPIHTPRGAWKYTSGFYPQARVPLYVSRGVATLGPTRIFCPPEVTLHTLMGA